MSEWEELPLSGTSGSTFYIIIMSGQKSEYLSNLYHPHMTPVQRGSEKLGFMVWPALIGINDKVLSHVHAHLSNRL